MIRSPVRVLLAAMAWSALISASSYGITINLENPPKTPDAPKKIWADFVRKPAMLDLRSPFEFAMEHILGSVLVRSQDYRPAEGHTTIIDVRFDDLARKLARLGVSPERPTTIIMANTESGESDGAWMGWLLYVLGIRQIKYQLYSDIGASAVRKTGEAVSEIEAPRWHPSGECSCRITADALSRSEKASDFQNRFLLIDLRSSSQRKRSGHIRMDKNLPLADLVDFKKLKLINSKDLSGHPIILYDQDGRGATLVWWLLKQNNVASSVLDGGFIEWQSSESRPIAH